MAKAASIKIKMVSSADTGYYYVAKKNSRTKTDKLVKKKYDPIAKRRVNYLILPSRNSTCRLAIGSYFFLTNLSVLVREFFLAT